MIEQAHQQHPELSVERWCELFSLSRSWYYERGGKRENDAQEIAWTDCSLHSLPGQTAHTVARSQRYFTGTALIPQ